MEFHFVTYAAAPCVDLSLRTYCGDSRKALIRKPSLVLYQDPTHERGAMMSAQSTFIIIRTRAIIEQ